MVVIRQRPRTQGEHGAPYERPRLVGLATRILGDHADTEDAVQLAVGFFGSRSEWATPGEREYLREQT